MKAFARALMLVRYSSPQSIPDAIQYIEQSSEFRDVQLCEFFLQVHISAGHYEQCTTFQEIPTIPLQYWKRLADCHIHLNLEKEQLCVNSLRASQHTELIFAFILCNPQSNYRNDLLQNVGGETAFQKWCSQSE